MAVKGYIGAIAVAVTLGAGAVQAQSVGVPAEFPPASFTGNQYVDSNGCAFIRAGIAGATDWVPRVNRQRQPLCSFQPSLPGAVARYAPEPIDPNLIIEITPPVQAAQAAPRSTDIGAPIQTVATIGTGRPGVLPQIVTPPPSTPRVVAAPAPAPVPTQAPAPTVTLAQACEGRFGVQPGFISSRTGNPIDCGPEPQSVAAVVSAPVVTGPPRMTMAQICAEVAATGRRFVNAETGQSISCAPATPLVIAAAPSVPTAPSGPSIVGQPAAPAPVATATSQCQGIPNLRGDGRYAVRCGPQTQRPYTEVTAPQVTRSRVSTSSAPIFAPAPVPASNPAISPSAAVPNPPAGFERIWKDGRINPQRGLQVSAVQQPVSARVSTRTAPAATAHRYVQVGSFGDLANADRLIAQLGGMGLPVASGQSRGLKIVAAGPFQDAAALARALQAVRGLGFSDAYTRN